MRLIIVGKGPLKRELEAQIQSAALSDHIIMLGEREDVPELMNAVDGYVMSSAWEGAPIVLLEASASRLPIVTTDVGGNGELIEADVTGLVVPSRDPSRLSAAMLQILDATQNERDAMGSAARNRIEQHFEMTKILDIWEELYLELLERNAAPKS